MAKTLHLGLPLSLYTIARRMKTMLEGDQAIETMLSAAWSTRAVEPDQLQLIADSVGVTLRPPYED